MDFLQIKIIIINQIIILLFKIKEMANQIF